MDEGRIAGTPEIWDATQLSRLDDVSEVDWECPGCTLPILPVAWCSEERKVTAHFRKKPGTHHHPECKYDLLCRSGRRSLGAREMGEPRSWIDRITFPEARPFRPNAVARYARARGAPVLVEHCSTRHSINAACQFHHVIAGDRKSWALTVDGVDGRNYFDVFAPAGLPPSIGPDTRIWFGELHVSSESELYGDKLIITLKDQVRDMAPARRAVVAVDLRGWSADQRRLFADRIEEAREEAKWTRQRQPPAPIIYALGFRSSEKSETIHLDHPRKFAIVTRP